MSFNQQLETLLKTLDKFTDKEGILLKQNIKHHAEQFDSELIKLLLNNKTTKAHFFDAIDEATIFNYRKFIDYIDDKNFLIDSYTKFANKVGLTISNKHMQQINEVALSFPFKDCVLEGGQSKDDEKRKEIFFNEVLANDEINRLLDKKVITSAKKYTKDGACDEINFKRDENGLIKDNLIIKGNNLLDLHTLKSTVNQKIFVINIINKLTIVKNCCLINRIKKMGFGGFIV
jgi:adenine-specific DNA-methyltransferase